MGGHEGWAQPNGFSLNGLLPNEAASVTRPLDHERWSFAEERTQQLIACIQPNQHSEERRNAVASFVSSLIMKCFPCEVSTSLLLFLLMLSLAFWLPLLLFFFLIFYAIIRLLFMSIVKFLFWIFFSFFWSNWLMLHNMNESRELHKCCYSFNYFHFALVMMHIVLLPPSTAREEKLIYSSKLYAWNSTRNEFCRSMLTGKILQFSDLVILSILFERDNSHTILLSESHPGFWLQ